MGAAVGAAKRSRRERPAATAGMPRIHDGGDGRSLALVSGFAPSSAVTGDEGCGGGFIPSGTGTETETGTGNTARRIL